MSLDTRGSFNGLNFGAGTSFGVFQREGLEDLPAIRSSDEDRPQEHGQFAGVDYVGPRQVILGLRAVARDLATFDNLKQQLQAAFQVSASEIPLYFDNSTRMVKARCRRRQIPLELGKKLMAADVLVEFLATDPRIYDAIVTQASIGLPTNTGGMTFPASFPLAFGSVGTGGLLTLVNSGTFPTRPVLTIQGPIDNPVVENVTAGRLLSFGISLASTDSLIVDLDARSVLLNGTASRRSSLRTGSSWWELAPGSSTIRFRANTYQAGAVLTVSYRSAWL